MSTDFTLNSKDQVLDRIYKTPLPGVWFIRHQLYPDERGVFAEISLIDDLNLCLNTPFTIHQINLSRSLVNVCRGFHAENWNKLITVTRGVIFSALADIRPQSPTYLQSLTFILGEGKEALQGSVYLEAGIANSYCVLTGPCDYFYCVDALYRDRDTFKDHAISLFDPKLNIPWPIPKAQMKISERDLSARLLS